MVMKMKHTTSSRTLSLVAIAALAGSASAGSVVISSVGPGGAVPDAVGNDIWNPSWNSVPNWDALITTVNVPHGIDKVSSIVLNNLQHTSRGDLHVYLENPAGQRFNLIVKPGATGNDLPNPFGDHGAVMVGNYTIVESGGASLQQGGVLGQADISGGTYNQYLNTGVGMYTNPVFPIANLPLSSISGSAGTWKLHVRDWNITQLGSIASWRLIGENNGANGFCFGDGALTACPCGNNGEPGQGCANTFYPGGALLAGFGFPYVSGDSMVLEARDMTGNIAVFFQGSFQEPALAIDDGLGCVGGAIIRLGTQPVQSGVASYPGPGDASISVKGQISPFGTSTRFYQVAYRNAANYCTPATTNRTNGVSITWVP